MNYCVLSGGGETLKHMIYMGLTERNALPGACIIPGEAPRDRAPAPRHDRRHFTTQRRTFRARLSPCLMREFQSPETLPRIPDVLRFRPSPQRSHAPPRASPIPPPRERQRLSRAPPPESGRIPAPQGTALRGNCPCGSGSTSAPGEPCPARQGGAS